MASKLIFEFENDVMRRLFLGMLWDGGIEDAIVNSLGWDGEKFLLDYSRAFKTLGWDGKGDPTVTIKEVKET